MKKTSNKQGWVSLYRKLLEDPIFLSDKGLRVWIWCLLKASHSKQTFLLGRQKITIKEGQFITGKNKAKEELNLSISTIWYWLGYLTAERYIERKATNKYTIITVRNWEKYQKNEKSCTQSCTQKEPKSVPYNNVNNDNNINTLQSKDCEEFSSKEYIAELLNSNQRHIHIIGLFWDYKKKEFDNIEQPRSQMKKLFRAAKDLKGYSDEQILAVFEEIDKESNYDKKDGVNGYVWTLSTIHKRLGNI